MVDAVGALSAAWLAKMLFDILLAGMAGIRLVGPALFADDEADDEVAIHADDLAFSDTALFGIFLLNVVGNTAWHAYETVMLTGAMSFYYSIWAIVEFVVLFLTWILFMHARKAQLRSARRAREEAKRNGSVPLDRRAG